MQEKKKSWKNLAAGIAMGLGVGIIILFGFGLIRVDKLVSGLLPTSRGPVIGKVAPGFALQDLKGQEISLNDQRGKPVLLNFWATWCAPCVIEMPNIEKLYSDSGGAFNVLAINADEPPKKVEKFVDDIGLTFDILLDPGANVQDLYHLQGYPTTFFLDADGVIQIQHIGTLTEEQLSSYLSQLGIEP